jgi:DNA-binding IclR family transcriptional regulator
MRIPSDAGDRRPGRDDEVTDMPSAPSVQPRRARRAPGKGRERLQALSRGLRALALLNRTGVATNVAVAKRLALKYSTAHRVLMVLTDMGLLHHDPLGHQFFVASGVRSLAAGVRDAAFVDAVALPRMRAWTRRHGLPVLLVTQVDGTLTVRASTDTHWPATGEKLVAGSRIAVRGSREALVLGAFAAAGPRSARELAVRRQGYAWAVQKAQGEVHVSVPVMSATGLVACLSIRCPLRLAGRGNTPPAFVSSLRRLAADLVGAMP